MENYVKEMFADVHEATLRRGEAPTVVIVSRRARRQWFSNELKLLAADRYRPLSIVRFVYRLFKFLVRQGFS